MWNIVKKYKYLHALTFNIINNISVFVLVLLEKLELYPGSHTHTRKCIPACIKLINKFDLIATWEAVITV